VLGYGIGLGGKLFDLLIVGGASSANLLMAVVPTTQRHDGKG